jgi:O-antigen ligase
MTINKINLSLFAILLIGYAFLSRGFAYIGYAPFFVGEVTLGVVLLGTLIIGPNLAFMRSPLSWLIVAFMLWQGLMLAISPQSSLVDMLRDSVIWGYAVAAFLVAALMLRTGNIGRTLEWYGRWLPWFLVWVPIGYLAFVQISEVSLPTFPGTEVQILYLKPGDLSVHLAGAAAFLALGLHRFYPARDLKTLAYKEIVWWGALAAGVIATGSRNRGGLLSVLVALAVVLALRPNNRLRNFLLPGLVIAGLFVALDVRVPIGGGREISVQQIAMNMESIFVGSKKESLADTSQWRIEWWKSIVHDSVFGDQFWTGTGYGPSLAEIHGFADGTGNRSPHNGHLTILARSGVPGLFLWLLLIGAIYLTLFKCYLDAQKNNEILLSNINIWVMAYFSAFLINTSFDVYLEGPQGGIWFWSLVGFAVALTFSQKVRRGRMAADTIPEYHVIS